MATDGAGAPPSALPRSGLHGRSLSFQKSKHARTVSYEEMQQMGLGKAIDVYYQMLGSQPNGNGASGQNGETESIKATASHETISQPSQLTTYILALLAPPVPWFLRPETILKTISLVWLAVAFVLLHLAPLIIPLSVWAALTPPTTLQITTPKILQQFVVPLNVELPSKVELALEQDWQAKAVAVAAVLLLLSAAEKTISKCRRTRAAKALAAVTHAEVEVKYAGCAFVQGGTGGKFSLGSRLGSGGSLAASLNAQDEAAVVAGVRELAQAYGHQEGTPSVVTTFEDAVAWLDVVAKEVGVDDDAAVAVATATAAGGAGHRGTAEEILQKVKHALLD